MIQRIESLVFIQIQLLKSCLILIRLPPPSTTNSSTLSVLMKVSERKEKKIPWALTEQEYICLTENIISFALQIESYYKLTPRNTRPKRTWPILLDRRMLVKQLIGR